MRVIATGLPDYRSARNMEGSALYHIAEGNIPGVGGKSFLNADRASGGYWHGYNPGDPNRPIMSAPATQTALQQNVLNIPR